MGERMTLRGKIEARIASKPGEDVFLPREFRDLGGEDQVLRVLRTLVQRNASYGSAMVSMVAPSYRVFPATPCFSLKTDFKGRYARRSPNSG